MFTWTTTCSLDDELDWLPRRLRPLRAAGPALVVSGGLLAAGSALTAIDSPVVLAGVLGGAFLYFAALTAGNRVSRRLIHRRALALVRGQSTLRELRGRKDRNLVHVQGTVRANRSAAPPGPPGTVFRRVVFEDPQQQLFVHFAANDFEIVSVEGISIGVEVEGGRLVVPFDTTSFLMGTGKTPVALPPGLFAARFWSDTMVRDGDRVDVLGWTDHALDLGDSERLHREAPLRVVVGSRESLPLLVSPVR